MDVAPAAAHGLFSSIPDEFFGIFAMSGTATSFVGPLAVGILTAAFHSQRASVAVGCVFLLGGLLVMRGVRESVSGREPHGVP